MKGDEMLMCLIAFVIGYLVAQTMRGDGFSVGGQHLGPWDEPKDERHINCMNKCSHNNKCDLPGLAKDKHNECMYNCGEQCSLALCPVTLEQACGSKKYNPFDCAKCAGEHLPLFQDAGCSNNAIASFCAQI